jgi:DNA-directed RNA polymerase subunit RPC12/RpoP
MSMRVKTWKIIDRGGVPELALSIDYTCMHCGREAELPVVGLALAQIDSAVVFDIGHYEMPAVIQCRKCGHVYERC